VSDQGVGIPQEYLHRVFDRDFRLAQPGQTTPRGSGLGLAMVERIVAHHGGQVRVESKPGEGSSFFFTLPSAPPP
jgi:signal transduction histidine kinase